MKQSIAILLCAVIPIAGFAASDNAFKVKYDGGSIAAVKSGSGLKLHIEEKQVRLVQDKADVLVIPASSITEVSFGQDVHRRVGAAIGLAVISLGVGALMAFSKSKKHFVGLTWNDDGKKGGIAFQSDKNEYRGVIAGLEGVSGKKAVNSDSLNVRN